jgi:transcriptional regulator with XRE-family HTH domain
MTTTVRVRQLGAELRRSRKLAGMVSAHVARKIGFSPSKMSRLESGDRNAIPEDVAGLLALYGVTGPARKELLALARDIKAGKLGWWQDREMSKKQRTLIELESTATRIINYESLLIPGLLQTGEYSRAMFRDVTLVPEDEIEDRMVTRLARHSVLMRRNPPQLLAIIYEPALRMSVGSADVMRRQLDHLVHAADRPHITIRVVPESAGVHPGLFGQFAKIELDEAPPVVFLENRTSSLFLEDQADLRPYDSTLNKLLTVALDAGESAELIADLATKLRQAPSPHEETVDARTEPGVSLMAQEQLFGQHRLR